MVCPNIKKCRRMKCALHSGPNRRTAELERIAGKAYGRNPAGETWPENSFKGGLFFSGVLFSSDVVYVVCTFVCARGVGKKLPATCCMRPACQNAKNVDYLTIYVPPGRQNNRP